MPKKNVPVSTLVTVDKQPIQVVSIPISLYQSMRGKYFVGQSELLSFGSTGNAWAGLFNPRSSGVNLHVNVFTITNLTSQPFITEIWFNPVPPGTGTVSSKVSPTNLSLSPPPVPKVQLQFASDVAGEPIGGVNVFDRLTPATGTLVSEEDGKYIVPPGENFLLFLKTPGSSSGKLTAIVAFGWWEEKIKCPGKE